MALADFERWVDSPMAFRPAGGGAAKTAAKNGASLGKKPRATHRSETSEPPAREVLPAEVYSAPAVEQSTELTFPVPIRAGLTVQLCGIPFDLTVGEAEKIAQVVKALASQQ